MESGWMTRHFYIWVAGEIRFDLLEQTPTNLDNTKVNNALCEQFLPCNPALLESPNGPQEVEFKYQCILGEFLSNSRF
jgi:hypothetical protein